MVRVAITIFLLLTPIVGAAQAKPSGRRIHVATRLVRIGVIVRNAKGEPVGDLKSKDFTIRDDGKPQPISFFERESAQAAEAQQPLPQNTFSDLAQYGANPPRSVTIVLLDNLNTLYSSAPDSQYEATPSWLEDLALQNAKTHLMQYIQGLDPEDRVAIYGLGNSLHVLCDFTSDQAQLLGILKSYDTRSRTNRDVVEPGHSNAPVLAGPEGVRFENGERLRLAGGANETRATETMGALRSIAAHVANIPGRKNLVWLTANLPFSAAAVASVLSRADIAVYPIDARGLLARSPMVMADVPGTADFDSVSGAGGHRDNMPAQSSQPIGIATMQGLAEDTGGQAFVNNNDLTGAIRQAVEDSAVTYTLGFYLAPGTADGKFHHLNVEVKRAGLRVRYPRGYFALADKPADKKQNWTRVVTAVQSPIQASTIPVQIKIARVSRPVPNSLEIHGSIDIRDLQLTESGGMRKGAVSIDFVEQDTTGKVLNEVSHAVDVQFTDERYAALLQTGSTFIRRFNPCPQSARCE